MLRVGSVVAIVAIGAAVLAAPKASVAGDVSAVLALPVGDDFGCSTCMYCDKDRFLVQSSWPGQPEDVGGEIDTACNWFGRCEDLFPCSGFASMEDVEDVRLALNENDSSHLAALIESEPEVYVLNRDRMALQVMGCDKDVIAHFPITDDQLIALAN